jgi:HPt (histidine-containing phosphotransfer) domain-containing protein
MDGLTEIHRKEFEAHYRAYMAELSEKLGAMQTAASVLARDGWDRPTAQSLYDQAHRIAGSSGVYGLTALSRASGILADRVKSLLEGPSWPPADSPRELATVVAALKRAARDDARQRR